MDGTSKRFRDDDYEILERIAVTLSRLREVEERVSQLEDCVKTDVESMMPEVDTLLSQRSDDTPASSSTTTSTSNTEQSASLLNLAERGEHEQILNLLTQQETSAHVVHQRTDDGDTALHVAARRGHLKTVVVLLGMGVKANSLGHQLRSPLHCAALHGHLDVVQRLLDAGAKIDAVDSDGATALDLATGTGDTDTVLLLIRKGARPSQKTIFLAAARDHWSLVELFLQNGFPVTSSDPEGNSLVVYAARARRWETVEMLLQKGASATDCKDPKDSALVIATKDGQVDTVRRLLLPGKFSNLKQIECALKEAKNTAVVRTFFEIVPDFVTYALVKAGSDGRLETLMSLLKVGVNINAPTETRFTALHGSARNGHVECVRRLLQRGADYDKKDMNGHTPLHMAALCGRIECVRVLVEAGAKVGEINDFRQTPAQLTDSYIIRDYLNSFK